LLLQSVIIFALEHIRQMKYHSLNGSNVTSRSFLMLSATDSLSHDNFKLYEENASLFVLLLLSVVLIFLEKEKLVWINSPILELIINVT